MIEKKPTDELTPEQLRRAIATLKGAVVETGLRRLTDGTETETFRIVYLGETAGAGYSEDDAWHQALSRHVIPDWPNDPGVAYLLCLEIALGKNWSVASTPYRNGTVVAEFAHAKTDEPIAHADAATPALALSRLAHAALTESET